VPIIGVVSVTRTAEVEVRSGRVEPHLVVQCLVAPVRAHLLVLVVLVVAPKVEFESKV